MKTRQAYEVAEEIEAKWKSRGRCMIFPWSTEHLLWLIQRWKFKKPAETERRDAISAVIRLAMNDRLASGLSPRWVYMLNIHVREMMVGATLKVWEPVVKPSTDETVIELRRRTGVPAS
jgi:hypothetical protein